MKTNVQMASEVEAAIAKYNRKKKFIVKMLSFSLLIAGLICLFIFVK